MRNGRYSVEMTWWQGNGGTGPNLLAGLTSATSSLFSLIVPDYRKGLVQTAGAAPFGLRDRLAFPCSP